MPLRIRDLTFYVVLFTINPEIEVRMTTETGIPLEIASEIDRLRLEFSDTQALYREVCVLLFFRHGITPTANKLYQLVHKGSMSAPTEALRAFWADLREKSRIRIENADLPDSLKTAAGELVATLWQQAQVASNANLTALRDEASECVRAAQNAQQAAEMEVGRRKEELAEVQRQAAEKNESILSLERQLAAERGGNTSLRAQLDGFAQQIDSLNRALNDARQDFASELEKQREALDRAEERLQGSERRALLEIDRERTQANRLQRELEQVRQTAQETIDRHQVVVDDYQKKLTDLLQRLGQAEGVALAQKEINRDTRAQLESAQSLNEEMDARLTALAKEFEAREYRIKELEALLNKPRSSNRESPRSRPRKNVFFPKR